MKQARFFLTLDSSGALIVGLFVLLFSSFLANLTGWTESFTSMENKGRCHQHRDSATIT
ncbi:hypothetical protein [Leptospira licerasiae]|uniref:hypothetical protein n=1 Tax=Leptospira licerasiae TaxID=447106 RepID=UPI001FED5938|nr:hypothetical protein [Leptospira licerasiae]